MRSRRPAPPFAEPGPGNHRQSAAESHAFLGHAVPPALQPQPVQCVYISNSAQFDLGLGYTFERGQKRQHRLQAAQDQTTVTRSHVTDNQRTLTFNVAQQFVAVLLAQSMIELAQQDFASFQQTVI